MTDGPHPPPGNPHPPPGDPHPSPGAPDAPGGNPGEAPGGPPADGAAPADRAPRRRWPRWVAVGAAAALLGLAGTGYALYAHLSGNLHADGATQNELEKYEAERPPSGPPDAENILLIGSDTRGGGNGAYGADNGTRRADTTLLLHLAADRRSATAVSIPRDLMVSVPACTGADGRRTPAGVTPFNAAFQTGGAACVIRTVEKLTGIRVGHHIIVDFVGFKRMVDAVGGVAMCLPRPLHDPQARIDLPAGRQTLHGEEALGFVRARKSLGNGSDTQRMERQQQFLDALVKKVQSNGVLLNPARLYPLLDAATSSLTTDKALASLTGLYELVRSTRAIPAGHVRFMTVPRTGYRYDANRDELAQPAADQLFHRLARDLPVPAAPASGGAHGPGDSGHTSSPNASDTTSSDEKTVSSPTPPTPSRPPIPATTTERGICE